jgi:hypothetical protein
MTQLSPVRPVFRAVVSTVVPEAGQLDERGWQELESLVETALGERPPAMLRQLRLFLRMIEWYSAARFGRTFSSLDAAGRARLLASLEDHRIGLIRCGFWGLRMLAYLGFYGRAEALESIGYAADARGWEARR